MLKYKKYFLLFTVVYMFLSYANLYAAGITGVPGAYDYKQAGVGDQIKQFLCAPTDVSNAPGSGAGYTGTTVTASGAANQAQGDLYTCINKLYKFAIILGSTIGVFFIVIAGYLYMSSDGNQESVDKAKDILVSTITAMVILMGGYVLLKAINPQLVQFKQIQPGSLIDISKFATSTDNFRLPDSTPTNVPGGTYTDSSARTYLSQNNVTVNYPEPRTSLQGIRPGIIQEIVNLKRACNCTVIVTGGTEPGHSTGEFSHAGGYKLDTGKNTTLDNYIRTTFTPNGTRSDGARLWRNSANGAIYADEESQGTGPHWDILLRQ